MRRFGIREGLDISRFGHNWTKSGKIRTSVGPLGDIGIIIQGYIKI